MTKYLPITRARQELPKLVSNVKKKMDEYIITVNGYPEAVLMSHDEYESLIETLDILSNPKLMKDIREAEKDIKAGRVENWDNVKIELGFE